MVNNLVSVITPVYNSRDYIGNTIRSVLEQSYQNWEMLIIDDCSTDDTAEVIAQFSDPRIKYMRLENNSGAAVARNIALEKARGRFIAFLDADDIWKPAKLERQLEFMVRNNIGFSFTAYEILRRDGNKLVKVPKTLDYNSFMKNTIIGTLTVVLDREIIGDIRLVDVRKDQDSMTWAKFLREGIVAHGLNESLAYYRKVAGSISSNKLKAFKTHWTNCRRIEGLSVLKCSYFFVFYTLNAIKKHYG